MSRWSFFDKIWLKVGFIYLILWFNKSSTPLHDDFVATTNMIAWSFEYSMLQESGPLEYWHPDSILLTQKIKNDEIKLLWYWSNLASKSQPNDDFRNDFSKSVTSNFIKRFRLFDCIYDDQNPIHKLVSWVKIISSSQSLMLGKKIVGQQQCLFGWSL